MKSKVGYSIGELYKTEPWFDDFGDTDELHSATNSQVGGDHYKNQGIQHSLTSVMKEYVHQYTQK